MKMLKIQLLMATALAISLQIHAWPWSDSLRDAIQEDNTGKAEQAIKDGADLEDYSRTITNGMFYPDRAHGTIYMTPLMLASYLGSPNVVRVLLAHKADPNHAVGLSYNPPMILDPLWLTPLMMASYVPGMAEKWMGVTIPDRIRADSKPEIVQLLVESGADINARDIDGWEPLMYAVRSGRPDIVRKLIELKANVNAQNVDGLTPLMIAVYFNQTTDIAKILLDNGADLTPSVFNPRHPHEKARALDIAKIEGRQEFITLLGEAAKNMPSIKHVESKKPLGLSREFVVNDKVRHLTGVLSIGNLKKIPFELSAHGLRNKEILEGAHVGIYNFYVPKGQSEAIEKETKRLIAEILAEKLTEEFEWRQSVRKKYNTDKSKAESLIEQTIIIDPASDLRMQLNTDEKGGVILLDELKIPFTIENEQKNNYLTKAKNGSKEVYVYINENDQEKLSSELNKDFAEYYSLVVYEDPAIRESIHAKTDKRFKIGERPEQHTSGESSSRDMNEAEAARLNEVAAKTVSDVGSFLNAIFGEHGPLH